MSRDGTNISSIYGLYQSERVNQSCKLSSLDQSDETARYSERHSPDLAFQRQCCTFPLVTAVHMDAGQMMSNLAWSKMELELFDEATLRG